MKHYERFKEFYSKELTLNEGLITTYPISSTISGLSRKWNFLKFQKTYSQFSKEANIITIILKSEFMGKFDFKEFLKLINTYGWFVSVVQSFDIQKRPISFVKDGKLISNLLSNRDANYLEIILEAKYDIELDMKYAPEYLFHITHDKYVEKIKSKGLIPKSNSTLAHHPERIYLAISGELAKTVLLKQLQHYSKENNKWYIVKIKTSKLPKIQRFFRDPNYDNGIYTLTNIYPECIEQIEEL